jgi:hypothetical protein
MPRVTEWQAVKVGGERIRRRELVAADLSALPFAMVERLGVETDSPAVPFVRVAVDPAKGDRAGIPCSRCSVDVGPGGKQSAVASIEIAPGPGRVVRLELHADGPVLVTADALTF